MTTAKPDTRPRPTSSWDFAGVRWRAICLIVAGGRGFPVGIAMLLLLAIACMFFSQLSGCLGVWKVLEQMLTFGPKTIIGARCKDSRGRYPHHGSRKQHRIHWAAAVAISCDGIVDRLRLGWTVSNPRQGYVFGAAALAWRRRASPAPRHRSAPANARMSWRRRLGRLTIYALRRRLPS